MYSLGTRQISLFLIHGAWRLVVRHAGVWQRSAPYALVDQSSPEQAREKHRAMMKDLFADVDPTRDPLVEMWEKGVQHYYEKTPLFGCTPFEEVKKNSSLTKVCICLCARAPACGSLRQRS